MFRKFILLTVTLGCTLVSMAQQMHAANYYGRSAEHDFSKLWFIANGKKNYTNMETVLPEPLGFIGKQYQRFYIHYTSLTKCKTNPCQYNVMGKTMVKDNVCNFIGTITIVKAGIYKEQLDNRFQQGFVECRVELYEDSTQKGSGFFNGKLVSKFYLDEMEKVEYDDLVFGADGYFNNQCISTWTNYKTHETKLCNWGDYWIPGSEMLNIGDGEFMVADKYTKNGWQNYKVAISGNPENAATKKAERKESLHWWQ